MKKYAFPNNDKAKTKLALDELSKYFEVSSACYEVTTKYISIEGGATGFYSEVDHDNEGGCISEDCELLYPSYVIAHAAELDGARKPWEIAPEGYRLVTEEEEINYSRPNRYMRVCNLSKEWEHNPTDSSWGAGRSTFAVPVDFTFAPPEKEIEVGGTVLKVGDYITALKNLQNHDQSWIGDKLKVVAIDKGVIAVNDMSCKWYADRVTMIFDNYVFQRLSNEFCCEGDGEIEVGGKMYSESTLKNALREYVG